MKNDVDGNDSIVQEIKHILVAEMELNISLEEIPDHYSLLESGLGLDSACISMTG